MTDKIKQVEELIQELYDYHDDLEIKLPGGNHKLFISPGSHTDPYWEPSSCEWEESNSGSYDGTEFWIVPSNHEVTYYGGGYSSDDLEWAESSCY